MDVSIEDHTLTPRVIAQRRRRQREREQHLHAHSDNNSLRIQDAEHQRASSRSETRRRHSIDSYYPHSRRLPINNQHLPNAQYHVQSSHSFQLPLQQDASTSAISIDAASLLENTRGRTLSRDNDSNSKSLRKLAQRARRTQERSSFTGHASDSNNSDEEIFPITSTLSQNTIPLARQPYQDTLAIHDLGRMDWECQHCGGLHWLAEKVSDSRNSQLPKFGTCCNHGEVHLPALQLPPLPLYNLYTLQTAQGKEFRKHIWEYNRALAFTSLGVKESIVKEGQGPQLFRIQGELSHKTAALTPAPNTPPRYAQLYIYDPEQALSYRMANNATHNLCRDTMQTLQTVIIENHQYTPLYLEAYELLDEMDHEADLIIKLRFIPGLDRRRYNLPTANEVAIITPDDHSTVPKFRDIHIYKRGGGTVNISECHPAYTPLEYVLLFPYGENGWHPNLPFVHPERPHKGKFITLALFVSYRLHSRSTEFKCLLRGGRLLQRYIVDMWAANEQAKLRYLRHNQNKFRATLYNGLTDALNASEGNLDLNELGQRIILPSSYIEGPRYMQQRFQDSMAIARYYKHVDLFLTMTTNPNWVEITRELLPGQYPNDRPDLIARVFRMKKTALIKDIMDGCLGNICAYVYSVEFQKRGLPHVHLLLFFDRRHKLFTPEDVNSLISAEWPDPNTAPELFDAVKKFMVHGPCDDRCLDEYNRCTRGYPKPFRNETNMDSDGYPQYQRRNTGKSYSSGSRKNITNEWIVPFIAYLLKKYNCHINAECATSMKVFKYLFKYLQKGSDRIIFELWHKDEIQAWQSAHYTSAAQSAYHLFQGEMHGLLPAVFRLQIHLPGQSMVYFNPEENPDLVHQRAKDERTTLTAFFEANRDQGMIGDQARLLTYQEFPQRMTWKPSQKRWVLRKKGFSLGRMYWIPPNKGELYYARLLLTLLKGVTSFEDLRTYGRREAWPTFREACIARGLLEDDGEWRQCLQEAAVMQTGHHLRLLFATLLQFCNPSKPAVLWHDFKIHVCDDLFHRLQKIGLQHPSEDQIYDYGLYLIDEILQESGHSLSEWADMPHHEINWSVRLANPLIIDHLNYDSASELESFHSLYQNLNCDQLTAYHAIFNEDRCLPNAGLTFVNGPGGTGKTYLWLTLCHRIRSLGQIVLAVASSGIAAVLIPGGRTSHSMFRIPIGNALHADSMCTISKRSHRATLLKRTALIIWDEVGAQHKWAFEAVDRTCQDIRNSTDPFGGIPVVFGGDFQQILPIVPGGSREDIIDSTIQSSYLWSAIRIYKLTINMRLGQSDDDKRFAKYLLDVGHGRHLQRNLYQSIPETMQTTSTEEMIDFIFPNINATPPPPSDYFSDRLLLGPRNVDVADLNEEVLSKFAGSTTSCFSADTILKEPGADDPDLQDIPIEVLRGIQLSGMPPAELKLKVGCPLILLRNLAPARGLCNGTRLLLQRIRERVLEVVIIGGDHHNNIALIPRISIEPEESPEFLWKFKRRQFPVLLAFALSINKAQGQSAKWVGVFLKTPVFAHGQLYVALSRATTHSRVKVLMPENPIVPNCTYNIVFPEILID